MSRALANAKQRQNPASETTLPHLAHFFGPLLFLYRGYTPCSANLHHHRRRRATGNKPDPSSPELRMPLLTEHQIPPLAKRKMSHTHVARTTLVLIPIVSHCARSRLHPALLPEHRPAHVGLRWLSARPTGWGAMSMIVRSEQPRLARRFCKWDHAKCATSVIHGSVTLTGSFPTGAISGCQRGGGEASGRNLFRSLLGHATFNSCAALLAIRADWGTLTAWVQPQD
jgi:hypothetical protein